MTRTIQQTMKNARSAPNDRFHQIFTNILAPVPGGQYEITQPKTQTLCAFSTPVGWEDQEYRQGVVEAEVEQGIAWQIRINREERGWKQSDLALRMKTGQSAISKLEDPDGGDVQLSTLIKAAHAFDCALVVRFVSFTEFAAITNDVRPDRLLACGFEDEKNQPKTLSNYGHQETQCIRE